MDFPVRMKRDLKRPSGYSLNPLEVQNKDLDTASQAFLYLGAPNYRFLGGTCSEKQILPRIFYYLRTAKNF